MIPMPYGYPRKLARAIITIVAVASFSHAANANEYPSKPVSIVVPYSAGGPVDQYIRNVAPKLAEVLKQPVIVLNKPGANEIIAAESVAKAEPDGYTLFAGTESAFTMNPHLYKKLPYNPQSAFAPISRLVSIPLVLFVPKTSPANNLREFIAAAKAADKSGKPMNYGSSGTGGIAHLPMAMFEKQQDVKMTHVAYKGAAPLIPDVIAGHIDAATLAVSVIEQHVKSGRLKAMAVSAQQRSAALPDVPTFKELGIADINAVFNIGIVAPAGTPQGIVNRLSNELRTIVTSAEFRKANVEPFSYVAIGSTPAEFKAWLDQDFQLQGERVKAAGAKLD